MLPSINSRLIKIDPKYVIKNSIRNNRACETHIIAIGGFPGSGKSTVAKKLSRKLGIPCFGSDSIRQALIKSDESLLDSSKASQTAQNLLFRLAEEQLMNGISIILDINLGWEFQWNATDRIAHRQSAQLIPIVLQASRKVCMSRIRKRHDTEKDPSLYAEPEEYERNGKIERVRTFIEKLDRSDIEYVNAETSPETVFQAVVNVINSERYTMRSTN